MEIWDVTMAIKKPFTIEYFRLKFLVSM